MILIADSGGTKTDWVFLKGKDEISFTSAGMHPVVKDKNQLHSIIQTLPQAITTATQIYFYGAGCSTTVLCEKVKNALKSRFASANIWIYHDILGACHALLGKKEGMAGILGTGVNTCLYNGEHIVANRISLGYLLGDEGGGAYLGKHFLKALLEGFLDHDITHKFLQQYGFTNKAEVIKSMYSAKYFNAFLASFVPFLCENKHHNQLKEILTKAFEDFFTFHVKCYENHPTTIHLVGSVAYYFKEEISKSGEKFGISIGKVMQKPIEGLREFYQHTLF